MVKAVVGEETRLQSAEDRLAQSAILAQVGLVIGKLSSKLDRGFIYDLVPTPPNDDGDPPCSIIEPLKGEKKKGSKPKSSADSSSLSIDRDWVAEHARQVSRLLVGGVKVIGVYVWVGESVFKNSTLVLCQTIKGVADVVPLLENDFDEMLLLHISYSPRRWTCRNCALSSNITASSLRPCDFKFGRILNSLQTFRCIYNFCMRLPFSCANLSNAKILHDVLLDGISTHAKELKSVKAIIDGNLVDVTSDELCTSKDVHEVELLLPVTTDTLLEASSQKNVVGILVYSGTVCSYSYLNSKESISQAIADIKDDIIISLRSRLDMISDEADRDTTAASADIAETNTETSLESVYQLIRRPLRKASILPFPRRVFIPWLAGTFICDYLLPTENFEALKDHVVELLSIEAPEDASTFLQPEKEQLSLAAKSFWDVAAPSYQSFDAAHDESRRQDDAMKNDPRKSTAKNFNGVFAGLVLLIAIILGSLFYTMSSD